MQTQKEPKKDRKSERRQREPVRNQRSNIALVTSPMTGSNHLTAELILGYKYLTTHGGSA